MAPDKHFQHVTLGATQAEAFITTHGHQVSLHLSGSGACEVTAGELQDLIEALQRAKAQIQAFQLARINAAHASLLLAA